jgi:hypothetical protein
MKSRFCTTLFVGTSIGGVAGAYYCTTSSDFSYRTSMGNTKEKLRTLFRQVEEKCPGASVISLSMGAALPISLAMESKYLSKVPRRFKSVPAAILYTLSFSELYDNYYRFLSAPVNAIQDVPFSQFPYLTSRIAWHSSNYARLIGVCYGTTSVWGEYETTGKNLLVELKKPQDKSLLEKIDTLQKEGDMLSIPRGAICWTLPCISHPNIDNVTTEVVNKAMDNPGKLYNLMFFNNSNFGHVIGVMASTEKDKPIVKYFDSNLREATFEDKDAAQKSLALTLRYGGYGRMFQGNANMNSKKLRKKELDEDVSFAYIMEGKIS